MDNIQKLIVGVLGVSGMIAMLMPSGDMLPVRSTADVQAAPPPPDVPSAPPISELAPDDDEIRDDDDSEDTDEDIFAMGEPAIDGNPMGQRVADPGMPQQAVSEYAQPQVNDYARANLAPAFNYAQSPQQPLPPPMPQPVLAN